MSLSLPFFPLTSGFFGLTYQYKPALWEEIFVCMQYLKIGYNDVLNLPTNERRYYMGMLIKSKQQEQEKAEEVANRGNPNAKGSRKTKVSGEALKNKIKSGEVPLS